MAFYTPDAAGYFSVSLSTGSSFSAPASWGHSGQVYDESGGSAICNGDSVVGAGDFNGDGNDDVYCRKNGNRNYFVGISNGASSFSFSIWVYNSCDGPLGTGDFNGDGKADLSCITTNNGTFTTLLSTGGSFLG